VTSYLQLQFKTINKINLNYYPFDTNTTFDLNRVAQLTIGGAQYTLEDLVRAFTPLALYAQKIDYLAYVVKNNY
jgi:hypothetical protein